MKIIKYIMKGSYLVHKVLKNMFKVMVDESYSDEEKEFLEYIFILYSFEIMKAVAIIFSFFVIGYIKEALIICTVMFFSRPFIGGYHEDTQFKCLIITFASVFWILLLGKNSQLTFNANILLIILSIFCIWNQAPLIDEKMPLTKEYLIKRNKIIGTIIISIFAILSVFIYGKSNYYIFITWTIVFQALMMFKKNKVNKIS